MPHIQSRTQVHPVIEELTNHLDAPDCYAAVKGRPWSFFLDSGMNSDNLGRYSFIGCDPFLVLQSRGDDIELISNDSRRAIRGNPFDVIQGLLRQYAIEPILAPVPFIGGAVGYFGYDLCHFSERLPATAADDLQLPDCRVAFYDSAIAFDHVENRTYIAALGLPYTDAAHREKRARERVAELKDLVVCSDGLKQSGTYSDISRIPAIASRLRSNFTCDEYVRAVARAIEYIAAGDIFQVNLSQRFDADLAIDPYELYLRLRGINPAPFASYLNFGDVTVAGASPERFLRLTGDLVETRPMKGTRPRGKSAAEDESLAAELLASDKDRAENLMIVDLERNDLGKVCEYGSVRVKELCTLEKYATVFQLTSMVEGRLRAGADRIDLLKACFPGGSITGAPKVRAMEIIDELEPTRRGIYTGAVGYMGFDGAMDLNMVIRTFVIKGNKVYFHVGGGIVSDSDPQAEYQETLDKARALMAALSLQAVVAD
jgi:para-aminobenzoate synthetase component 1